MFDVLGLFALGMCLGFAGLTIVYLWGSPRFRVPLAVRAISWAKRNAWIVVSVIGAAIGALLLIASRRSAIETPDDALEVQAQKARLARLRATRIEDVAGELDPEIAELVREIEVTQNRIRELENPQLKKLSDQQLADKLTRAGW